MATVDHTTSTGAPGTKIVGGRSAGARERLLEAAAELFYQHGINAVGIDAVIERAGVAKMSLYNHFKSKDDLIAAFLSAMSEKMFAFISAEVTRHAGPSLAGDPGAGRELLAARARARIMSFYDAVYEWCSAREFRGCPFLNTAAELANPAHPGHGLALAYKLRVREFLEADLKAAGVGDSAALAHQFLLLADGGMSCAVLTGNLEGLERAKAAGEVLLSAALPR